LNSKKDNKRTREHEKNERRKEGKENNKAIDKDTSIFIFYEKHIFIGLVLS
jgi:hypothetical protein